MTAFGIYNLWRYGIIKMCFTCLVSAWGIAPLNLSFSGTNVKKNKSIIFMFCTTKHSISWYWPQWLVQEEIQAQPSSSHPGIVTEVIQKLEAVLPKEIVCLQNYTDMELFKNIFAMTLKKIFYHLFVPDDSSVPGSVNYINHVTLHFWKV